MLNHQNCYIQINIPVKLMKTTTFQFVSLILFHVQLIGTSHTSSITEAFTISQFTVKSKRRWNYGSMICMVQTNGDNNNNFPKSAKVRFSEIPSISTTNSNLFDTVLSWVTSDFGSIVLGGIGLILLLFGRIALDSNDADMSPEALGEQTRVNLLAVFAIGAVLLNGLSQLDVQSALAEKVDLIGNIVVNPVIFNRNKKWNDSQISWVLSSIISATPAKTVVLLIRSDDKKIWEPIASVGVVPPNIIQQEPQLPETTPIMDRMLRVSTSNNERVESYLPTLQALPGRTEFTKYLLPSNTQAALLLPIQHGILLLGSNQARSFTPRDIAWLQTVAARLEIDKATQ